MRIIVSTSSDRRVRFCSDPRDGFRDETETGFRGFLYDSLPDILSVTVRVLDDAVPVPVL